MCLGTIIKVWLVGPDKMILRAADCVRAAIETTPVPIVALPSRPGRGPRRKSLRHTRARSCASLARDSLLEPACAYNLLVRDSLRLSRRLFTLVSIGGGAATILGRWAEAAGGPVVVELFTHQGCAPCPPADAFLAELDRKPNVIPLSLHVDYWDYLGWRDTLGSPDCAQRQRDYARRRGDGRVYTPQVIINGRSELVGLDWEGILDAIADELARASSTSVPISLASGERELLIEVAAAPSEASRMEATVWVLVVVPQIVIDITRGENSGRTMSYTNVVRKIIPAGLWVGDELALSLPKAAVLSDDSTCAALLQVDGTGPIVGAGWLSNERA